MGPGQIDPRSRVRRWHLRGLLALILLFCLVEVAMFGGSQPDRPVVGPLNGFFIWAIGFILAFGCGLGALKCLARARMLARIAGIQPLAGWTYTDAEWETQRAEEAEQEHQGLGGVVRGLLSMLVVIDLILVIGLIQEGGITPDNETAIQILAFFNVGVLFFFLIFWFRIPTRRRSFEKRVLIAPKGVISGDEEYIWDLCMIRPETPPDRGMIDRFLLLWFPIPLLSEVRLDRKDPWHLDFFWEAHQRKNVHGYVTVMVPSDQHDAAERVLEYFSGRIQWK